MFSFSGQGQTLISNLESYDIVSHKRMVILSEPVHMEAPNWSPDGKYLVYNSQGLLYRLDLESGEKSMIETGFARQINNDHGISPDGTHIVISCPDEIIPGKEAENWLSSRIYIIPASGGTPRLVTPNAPSFWHGWSPDGQTLAYVARRNGEFDIYSIDIEGGEERRLSFEQGLDDGPDYSPDGQFIYYNSFCTGNMEIWRMRTDGSEKTRLTEDPYSNWFPHPSPDGKHLVFLSYLEDQGEGHPPMKKVFLRLMEIETGQISILCEFTGGQGTINVPSWHPDGKRFAFVSYVLAD